MLLQCAQFPQLLVHRCHHDLFNFVPKLQYLAIVILVRFSIPVISNNPPPPPQIAMRDISWLGRYLTIPSYHHLEKKGSRFDSFMCKMTIASERHWFVIHKNEKYHVWKISCSSTFTLSGCCSTSQVQEAGSLQPWKVWTSPLIQVVIGQKKMIENSARGTIMMAKETTGSLQFREVVKGNFLNFWSFDWNLYLQQVRQCKQHSTTHENTNVQSIEITITTWATSHFHWKESQQEGLARPRHHLCRFLYHYQKMYFSYLIMNKNYLPRIENSNTHNEQILDQIKDLANLIIIPCSGSKGKQSLPTPESHPRHPESPTRRQKSSWTNSATDCWV